MFIKSRIRGIGVIMFFFFSFFCSDLAADQGIGIPTQRAGIGFGNLKNFTGLRFNIVDNNIGKINGINITFWKPREEFVSGVINGISLGILPYAEKLNGIQLGVVGTGAKNNLHGLTMGLVGAGAGGNMTGINIGGIGVGCGNNLTGINIGGIGVGAGNNVTGINFGGLGIGAGRNLTGINIGLLGAGAGENVTGINIGGIGVGAGNNLTGLSIAGLGAGAPNVKGVVVAGLGAGGNNLSGGFFALGTVRVTNNGEFKGLAVSCFNQIKGTQKGVAIGIVNYAYRLKGIQIGLINIVRDNPAGRTILPIININF